MGFSSEEEAKDDAFSCSTGMEFLVLYREPTFAWCAPVEYAERVAKNNDLTVVGKFISP